MMFPWKGNVLPLDNLQNLYSLLNVPYLVGRERFELPKPEATRLQRACFNHLHTYPYLIYWWARRRLNLRHLDFQSNVLPAELPAHMINKQVNSHNGSHQIPSPRLRQSAATWLLNLINFRLHSFHVPLLLIYLATPGGLEPTTSAE